MMKYILPILVILSLALVGCSGGDGSTTGGSQATFLGGSSGLDISFSPGAPPSEIFDNDEFDFDLEVKLDNVGEHDVAADEVIIKIQGISPDEFGTTDSAFRVEGIDSDLKGAKKDSTTSDRIEGDIEYVIFDSISYVEQIIGSQITRPIIANVCYEYGTQAIADLCITSDVTDDDSDVCTVNENKGVGSSAGPVRISSFLEKSAGQDKVEFQFVIQQADSTVDLYRPDSKCLDERSEENVVFVDVDTGIDGLKCTGLREGTDTSGLVTLRSGTFTVRCTQEVDTNSDFERTAKIDLAYAVEDSASTSVTIKKSQ